MKALARALFCGIFLMLGVSHLNIEENQIPVPAFHRYTEMEKFAWDILARKVDPVRKIRFRAPSFEAWIARLVETIENASKVKYALPECELLSPCVIKKNSGGSIAVFRAAAMAALSSADIKFVIDGECMSACVLFADEARPKVCITERAEFWFHKAYNLLLPTNDPAYRFDPPHSPDIEAWVEEHGGFPTDDAHMLKMYADEAKWYWPRCKPDVLMPRPGPRKGTTAAAE